MCKSGGEGSTGEYWGYYKRMSGCQSKKRHTTDDKYMNLSPSSWNLEWALDRFKIYLKEMKKQCDQ